MISKNPKWLDFARELQSMSQTGLTYAKDQYEIQRYKRLLEISAQIVELQTELSKETMLQAFSIQLGYATPKVDVRGAVVQDGKILLVREKVDGKWCLPGGWADVGDLPSDMVIRETREESGFEVEPYKVVGVYDANRVHEGPIEFFHAYKIILLCKIISGAARPSDETLDVQFFDFDNVPQLSIHRTNERHLNDILLHIRNPNHLTLFD
jgi:ADP-ribose pyrophosphatase YjhB (NUDIX family)